MITMNRATNSLFLMRIALNWISAHIAVNP